MESIDRHYNPELEAEVDAFYIQEDSLTLAALNKIATVAKYPAVEDLQ